MSTTRVIPILLLDGRRLVKTVCFCNQKYVGDPINTVRLFNEKEVDEMILLEIGKTRRNQGPDFDYLKEVASEAFMPLAYGGGITKLSEAENLFRIGFEKVVINTSAHVSPSLVTEISKRFGSQSVVVSIDLKRSILRGIQVKYDGLAETSKDSSTKFAKQMQDLGAGELIVTSVDREGTFAGYDINAIAAIANSVDIPVIANGGARSLEDFRTAVLEGKASAVAAGSYFIFHGKHRAVLITYPTSEQLARILP